MFNAVAGVFSAVAGAVRAPAAYLLGSFAASSAASTAENAVEEQADDAVLPAPLQEPGHVAPEQIPAHGSPALFLQPSAPVQISRPGTPAQRSSSQRGTLGSHGTQLINFSPGPQNSVNESEADLEASAAVPPAPCVPLKYLVPDGASYESWWPTSVGEDSWQALSSAQARQVTALGSLLLHLTHMAPRSP
jgi:hypothetical protein